MDGNNVRSVTEIHAKQLADAAIEICIILKPLPKHLWPVILRGLLKGFGPDEKGEADVSSED